MLLVDDLLKAPFSGLMFVLREVAKAADAERDIEDARILARLSDLHRQLEAGAIGEAAFDEREAVLLDALDRLRGATTFDDDHA